VLLAAGQHPGGAHPASGEVVDNGTDAYHGLGALLAFTSSNLLVILLGRSLPILGLLAHREGHC
jgi:hypothetical protein